jgi:hypothetical protein
MIWWDYVGSSSTVSFSSGHRLWVKCKRGGRTRQARVEWAHLTLPKSPAYRSRCAGAVAIVKSDTNTKNGKGDNRSTNFYGEYVGRCLRRFPQLGHQIRHLRKGNSGMSIGPSPATVELIMIVEASCLSLFVWLVRSLFSHCASTTSLARMTSPTTTGRISPRSTRNPSQRTQQRLRPIRQCIIPSRML